MLDESQPSAYALLLAAAPGDGFLRSRWLEPWGSSTLIEHAVAAAEAWPVAGVVVVLGDAAEEIVAACDLGMATIVIDREWQEGAAAWLRVGLDTLTRAGHKGPVVVGDASIPGVLASDVATVIEAHDPSISLVTVAKYRYATGVPYVIDPEFWPRLMGREGSADLDLIWKAHPDWVVDVRLDRIPPRRIANPLDLEELRPSR